jgi:hypothetical protein
MDRRYVGIDLHRRRSVIYAMDAAGDRLFCERIANEPMHLLEVVSAGHLRSLLRARARNRNDRAASRHLCVNGVRLCSCRSRVCPVAFVHRGSCSCRS